MTQLRHIDDQDAWDRVVQAFPNCDLRQSHAWGETRRHQGWKPVRMAAFDGDACLAAIAVYVRRIPGLGAIAYGPRAPMFDASDERAWAAVPSLVRAVGRAARATFVRVSLGFADDRADVVAHLRASGFTAVPEFWSVWNSPRNVMLLDLAGEERDLLARMARKRRQHISTAGKKGITTEWSKELDALQHFYAMLREHAERLRYPIRDWKYFEALHKAFAPRGELGLVFGLVQRDVACALLGVRYGTVAYPLYAPSTPAARGTAVGDLVHWEWIRWARAEGCRQIDFGSSGTHVPPRETDSNYGIYRFKTELGCRLELNVPYHDYVFAPLRYRAFRMLERSALPRLRRLLGRMPPVVRAVVARRAA
jgi:lipid II:glycine glycyltransferase (peptidoglycan interpeptide bridge formation enzyme)